MIRAQRIVARSSERRCEVQATPRNASQESIRESPTGCESCRVRRPNRTPQALYEPRADSSGGLRTDAAGAIRAVIGVAQVKSYQRPYKPIGVALNGGIRWN